MKQAFANARKIRAGEPRIAILPSLEFAFGNAGAPNSDFIVHHTVALTGLFQRVPNLHVVSASSACRGSLLRLAERLGDSGRAAREIATRLGADFLVTTDATCREQAVKFDHAVYHGGTGECMTRAPFEHAIGKLLDYEKETLGRVAAGILGPVRAASIELALDTDEADASPYLMAIQAQLLMNCTDEASLKRADNLLMQGLQRDPQNATLAALRARIRSLLIGQGIARDPKTLADEARRFADQALAIDPENAIALAVAGHLASFVFGDLVEGHSRLEAAIDACPNEPSAWMLSAATLSFLGQGTLARDRAQYALSLSPLDPHLFNFHAIIALSCYANADYPNAVLHADLSIDENPRYTASLRLKAASLVALGRLTEARETARKMRSIEPRFNRARAESIPYRDGVTRRDWVKRLEEAGAF